MGAALILFLVVAVVITVAVNVILRDWVRAESRREEHVRDPRTHTLAYGIPSGVDPATIEAALIHAGLPYGVDRVGTVDCVRIECEESQREQVRQVLQGIHLHAYDGAELDTTHVLFEDER